MKAERRHELQHNELADWVAVAIERIKPYSRAIVAVAVAAAVLLTTYVVLSGRAERKESTAWTDYYLAIQGPRDSAETDLEAVIREHEGLAASRWAEVALADLKLGEGIGALFVDKAAAKKNLERAVEHYQAVIPKAEDPLLVARARFGLARALESLGQLDRAREVYEQIVEASGTNAYVSVANARLEDLKRDSTREFYAWFDMQEPVPTPPAAAGALPGTPGEKLRFDASSLDTPGGLNLSGDNILNIPGLETGTNGQLLTPPTKKDDEKGANDTTDKKPDTQADKEVSADAKQTNDAKAEDGKSDGVEVEDSKSESAKDGQPGGKTP